jgi:hypothetical protein
VTSPIPLTKLRAASAFTPSRAYAHLRGAGRMGSVGADSLIEFGHELLLRPRPWFEAARRADSKNTAAFRKFRSAWRRRDARLTKLCKVRAR